MQEAPDSHRLSGQWSHSLRFTLSAAMGLYLSKAASMMILALFIFTPFLIDKDFALIVTMASRNGFGDPENVDSLILVGLLRLVITRNE